MNLAAGASAAALALALAIAALPARAAPRVKVDGICKGCVASVPAAPDETRAPAPLLVTLHGDWGAMAPELHAAWERFAAPRGVALLSLTCPVELGCKRSFWQWNGGPSWITDQIDRLDARRAIDRERLWIAGWSGGATYIGMHTQELERTFAAIVIHGGGLWPLRAGCAPEKAPVTFLIGDQNPLHAHVLKLRDHYQECGNEVVMMLLRGAEHDAEWSALDRRGGPIMDWLATKRHVAVAARAPSPSSTPAPTSDGSAEPAPPAAASAAAQPAVVPPRARTGCGCALASSSERAPWLLAGGLVALTLRRKRRSSALRTRAAKR